MTQTTHSPRFAIRLIALSLAALISACARTGAVEGDVFSAQAGVVARAAGDFVYVIHAPDSARATLHKLCAQYEAHRGPLTSQIDRNLPDAAHLLQDWPRWHAAHEREEARRDSLKNELILSVGKFAEPERYTRADVNGHFRMDSLAAGPYLLLAFDPSLGMWLDTVRVSAGKSARHDLSQPLSGEVLCWAPVVARLPATGS